MKHSSNLILDRLPDDDREAILTILAPLELQQGQTLLQFRKPLDRLYFPLDAVVSLVIALSTGELIEAAMIGRDGVVGAGAIVSGVALSNAVVQLSGRCLSCDAKQLRPLLNKHPKIASLLVIHEQVILAQAQQSAACNVAHAVEARLARLLLRAHDLHGTDALTLTQDQLAAMLGVRRSTVSTTAHVLQTAGMIQYRRGNIKLIDIGALEDAACECYVTVQALYDELKLAQP